MSSSYQERSNQVTHSELRWVWIFSLLVLLITTIPYLFGFARDGANWRFSGFVFGVEDGNSYIAKMLIGASGGWLFRTPYTAYMQSGVVAFLPYILLGKLSAPPGQHEQLVVLFHLFRIVAGVLAIRATYDLIAYYLQGLWQRRFALALIILGGGLGWLLVLLGKSQLLGSLPLELYSPETFGFLGIYGIPHLSLARAGLLWGLLVYIRANDGEKENNNSLVILLGLCWLVVTIAQPLTAIVMGFVLALHLLSIVILQVLSWHRTGVLDLRIWLTKARVVFLSGLIPLPFLLYIFIAFTNDPFLIEWTAQNIITSPHPLHYLLAYGILIPPTWIGSRVILKKTSVSGSLLIGWMLALPFLAYAPYNLQRRLPEGIWVAIVILAVAGSVGTGNMLRDIWRYVLLLAFPSTVFLIVGGILAVKNPSLPVFRPEGEVEAFDFLAGHASNGDVVIAAYSSGNALPAWAPVRVVIGHGPESIRLNELNPRIQQFYSGKTDKVQRTALLEEFNVKYVFWGPDERQLGDWNPESEEYLVKIFDNYDYKVFQVRIGNQ